MSAAVVEGLIGPGDVVAMTGDRAFFEALKAALGDKAVAFVDADLDTRPDVHVTMHGDEPVVTRLSPKALPAPAASPDTAVFLVFAGETARQRKHLCGLAPVVLDGVSATFARVLKAAGAEVAGTGLQLIDGRPVVTRLDA
jgi:hypothetical protein